jgi:hypothetical protein
VSALPRKSKIEFVGLPGVVNPRSASLKARASRKRRFGHHKIFGQQGKQMYIPPHVWNEVILPRIRESEKKMGHYRYGYEEVAEAIGVPGVSMR